MKASKKPKRPNPFRSNIGFIGAYVGYRFDKPIRIAEMHVTRNGTATILPRPKSPQEDGPRKLFTLRVSTRQPPGYYAQTVPLKHRHSAAKFRAVLATHHTEILATL